MSDPAWVDDQLDLVDAGWWAAQEAADAREEAENGTEQPAPRKKARPWEPAHVTLAREIGKRPSEFSEHRISSHFDEEIEGREARR